MTNKDVKEMSEKEVKKTEKPGFFTRAKNWIVALPGRISGAFKNMVSAAGVLPAWPGWMRCRSSSRMFLTNRPQPWR